MPSIVDEHVDRAEVGFDFLTPSAQASNELTSHL